VCDDSTLQGGTNCAHRTADMEPWNPHRTADIELWDPVLKDWLGVVIMYLQACWR
jgi:hypothetical protein